MIGPWEDIKHLIHYVVTIDTTCAQAAKGREDIKSQYDVMQQKGHVSHGHVRGKETRQLHFHRSNFYKKK
jgi:hypothetical protein